MRIEDDFRDLIVIAAETRITFMSLNLEPGSEESYNEDGRVPIEPHWCLRVNFEGDRWFNGWLKFKTRENAIAVLERLEERMHSEAF